MKSVGYKTFFFYFVNYTRSGSFVSRLLAATAVTVIIIIINAIQHNTGVHTAVYAFDSRYGRSIGPDARDASA